MVTFLSALVASACVLASVRRLVLAASTTWLDPQVLLAALDVDGPFGERRVRDAIAVCDAATWERELIGALGAGDESSRVALVNETLRDLDWNAHRWARAPRVCARVASSGGFLFACIALTEGIALPAPDVGATLFAALDALAVGIAGMSFCIAVQGRARRLVRERLAATDRLVARLERCAAARSSRLGGFEAVLPRG